MSQKKVDAYKSRKGQRNKADRKEKVLFGLEMFAWVFICVVIVAWIGYSAYVKVTGAKADVVQNTGMDTTAVDNYISNLSANTSDDADGADTDSADADSTDNAADVSETESSDTDAADKAEVEDNTATADDKETSDDASAETTDDAATADADSTDAK